MDLKAPVGLSITTYEINGQNYTPTLTHIFWGEDLKGAIGIAQSHLITDFFFSASFEGNMPWGNDVLILSNTGQLLGKYEKGNLNNILKQLGEAAVNVNNRKVDLGIVRQIQVLSQE